MAAILGQLLKWNAKHSKVYQVVKKALGIVLTSHLKWQKPDLCPRADVSKQ